MRKIEIGAINIVMPDPHSPERYVDLLQKAARRLRKIPLRGDEIGLLASARESSRGSGVVVGEMYRYLDLDETRDWYNTQTHSAANDKDLAEINIPDNLKPHFKSFHFLFLSHKHRFFFVSRDQKETMSPLQAAKLLDQTFTDISLQREFGPVRAFAEPAHGRLADIFGIKKLTKLQINIETQPNPDVDDEDIEREIKTRLDAENAKTLRQELTAKDDMSLAPSQDTKNLAKVAASNGFVRGFGYDKNGRKVERSTQDIPWVESVKYNPNAETRMDVLARIAQDVIRLFRA